MSVFLTGTDTGVGKTFTAVALLRLLRAAGLKCAGMKPICCGDRDDAELILAASSDGLTIDEVNPVWFQTPAAPYSASLIEDVVVQPAQLRAQLEALQRRFDLVVVEGVGGWLVPIRQDYFVSDLAREMGLPVLVVVLNRLGCLNHTMLTIRSIKESGSSCVAAAINTPDGPADLASATNEEVLRKIAAVPILAGLAPAMTELPVEWAQTLGL